MSALPALFYFYIQTGDTTSVNVVWKMSGVPVSLSGITIEWTFSFAGNPDVVCIEGDGLTLDAVNGSITLNLDSAITEDFIGRGRHKLQVTSPYTRTLLEGEVICSG